VNILRHKKLKGQSHPRVVVGGLLLLSWVMPLYPRRASWF
jgi:hypothetical protein